MQSRTFEIILFDLGGVLIDSSVIKRITGLTTHPSTVRDLSQRWPSIHPVRDFDLGMLTPFEFASAMTSEFSIPMEPESFLQEYNSWVKPYPQTFSLLEKLSSSFTLAALSNTNEPHWTRVWKDMGLERYFASSFPSYRTGLLKPAKETYLFVLRSLNCSPEQVLFFDDYQPNVDGAISVGMTSFTVSGVVEVESKLRELGMI
jgi:putative hydrolase of the HAD superfamily